jgi:prepilin-type N-terminal cleavage/methylation domain-containing protein
MKTPLATTARVMIAWRNRKAFTLVEIMIASAIMLFVFGGLTTVLLWMLRTTERANRYASVQAEARRSQQLISHYIRNGSGVAGIDLSGNWVRIRMPSGHISQFRYVSDPTTAGLGYLEFLENISGAQAVTNIIARGMSKVMTLPVRNVFELTGSNTLRVAYRISAPHPNNGDGAAEVDSGIRLRNF